MTGVLIFFLCAAGAARAQDGHQHLREGDKAYQNSDFSKAEVSYRRANEEKSSSKSTYNLGNATYRQDRYEESVKQFETAAQSAQNRDDKAKAFHNLGNAHYKKGQFKESVEAYKNALRLAPKDSDTKRNLANAIRRLPPPPPQQQNQKNKDKQKEQQKKDQQKDDKNQQRPDQQQPNDQPPKEQEQPQNLNKEEASQLLDIMDQEEKKVQSKMRKAQARNKKSDKDW